MKLDLKTTSAFLALGAMGFILALVIIWSADKEATLPSKYDANWSFKSQQDKLQDINSNRRGR